MRTNEHCIYTENLYDKIKKKIRKRDFCLDLMKLNSMYQENVDEMNIKTYLQLRKEIYLARRERRG